MMTHVKFDEAAELAESNQKVRDIFQLFGGNVDLKNLGYPEAVKVRPFLSASGLGPL